MRVTGKISRSLLLGFFVLIQTPLGAGTAPQVSPLVLGLLEQTSKADFFVVLKADPGNTIARSAPAIYDKQARQGFVVDSLHRETLQSQNDLGLWLGSQGADYQNYWIVNQILVRQGSRELLQKILNRPEVLRVDANPRVRTNLPEPQSPPRDMLEQAGPEGNIAVIKADQVWSTYGITGDGVVVAVNDTGVQWTHEALLNTYRGWNGVGSDHTYSWHDAVHSNNHGANSCGTDATAPCDDFGHGTNVAGIIGGRTASNQIGVAPGTEWIACRCMDNGYGTPASYLECLQWFLAPGGDVAKAPDIINNSWSCPPSEGCSQATLESAFLTVRAAGIMVVARNENTGPSCASATDPPGMYEASFSVGATDNSDNLAGFSSRGPVTYNGKTYTKPDISAPGVSIRSSAYDGGYILMTGTSMAAPHVAGAAALLWSGNPTLKGRIDLTEDILKTTARPKDYTSCGDPAGVPNNGFGWGIVDALAAFQKARILASPTPPWLLLLD